MDLSSQPETSERRITKSNIRYDIIQLVQITITVQGQKIWWLDHTPCEENKKKKPFRVAMKRKTRRVRGVCRNKIDRNSRKRIIKVRRRKL